MLLDIVIFHQLMKCEKRCCIATRPHECESHEHSHDRPSEVDPTAVEQASRIFRALGDPARLRLLHLLIGGEWCVGEIVEAMGEKFSTVSQRLRLLRTERLIVRRREGTHLYYALADQHVIDLIENALAHAMEPEKGSVSVARPTPKKGTRK